MMARTKVQRFPFGPVEEIDAPEPAQDIVLPDGTSIDIEVTITPAPKPVVELDEYHQENP
jgi:hypothetical protein